MASSRQPLKIPKKKSIRPKKAIRVKRFATLSEAELNKIVAEIESKTPEQHLAESRPLNKRERAQWKELKKKMGRPKIGKGSKIITMSIERDLLKRATQFAKAHGLNRSALIAQGLETVMSRTTG